MWVFLTSKPTMRGQGPGGGPLRTCCGGDAEPTGDEGLPETSEPHVSEWISKAFGEVKIERFRETRTHGEFPVGKKSESEARDITREPLW